MKRKNNISHEIQWDTEPVSLKTEEYFKYFDVDTLSDSLAANADVSSLYIMSHKSLNEAIYNNTADEDAELVLFDRSKYSKGTFAAYVIPNDMPEISMQIGDCAILDINKKHFDGNGFYVLNTSGVLNIRFIPASDETDFLIIEAKVCEIRRKL